MIGQTISHYKIQEILGEGHGRCLQHLIAITVLTYPHCATERLV